MYNKVVWSEGMFLHPQHFQQQDRYIDFLLRTHSKLSQPYYWGFEKIEFDTELLSLGKIKLKQCQGIFSDGTYFNTSHLGHFPSPIEIPIGTVDTYVYLTLPIRQTGEQEITDKDNLHQPVRYKAEPITLQDNTSEDFNDSVQIQVAIPQIKLSHHPEEKSSYSYLIIAKIKDCLEGIGIQLDPTFIPPLLNIKSFTVFKDYIHEFFSLLSHRAEVLASRVAGIEEGGVSELADFMLLQLMNRYEAIFQEFIHSPLIHPYQFYKILTQLLAEISPFTLKEKRYIKSAIYDHQNLAVSIHPLIQHLRQAFLKVLYQNARSFIIEQQKANLWFTRLIDFNLLENAEFILAVHAQVEAEELRQDFPKNFKISSFEQLMDLVTYSLPGISLKPLQTVPRKIPFYKGYIYFALDKSSLLWETLKNSSGIGFHSSKLYPDLKFELWAIPESTVN